MPSLGQFAVVVPSVPKVLPDVHCRCATGGGESLQGAGYHL